MTHDELLARLEGIWHDSFKAPGYQALRSVVELHKPFEIDREGNYNCQECEWEHPCQTIQAIEKELG
jgi:hypothetical protein